VDEVIMLLGEKSREILDCVRQNRIPANMSYSIDQRWRRNRIFIETLTAEGLNVTVTPRMSSSELGIQQGQLVGISFQCEYGHSHDRFIFGSEVLGAQSEHISLAMPEEIEIVRNKSFLRCAVPEGVVIDTEMCQKKQQDGRLVKAAAHICQGFSGRLMELSADSLNVAVSTMQGPDLRKGDYLTVRFVPFDNETPITVNACVKHMMPTEKAQEVLLDMEIIGLEVSPEGRMVLRRLCGVVSQYRQQAHPASSGRRSTTLTAAAINSWLS
jgi:hypothetical protein